jgi:DNA-damage-inducible protein J
MAKTAAISMRVDPELKSEAESVFGAFGLTLAEAINVFLHKSVMEGGLPFDVRQPRYNKTTESAMREARDIMSGKVNAESYDSVDEMFAALDE